MYYIWANVSDDGVLAFIRFGQLVLATYALTRIWAYIQKRRLVAREKAIASQPRNPIGF